MFFFTLLDSKQRSKHVEGAQSISRTCTASVLVTPELTLLTELTLLLLLVYSSTISYSCTRLPFLVLPP